MSKTTAAGLWGSFIGIPLPNYRKQTAFIQGEIGKIALVFVALVGVEARSAELEGALQYPLPQSGRMPSHHRRLEQCRSSYRRRSAPRSRNLEHRHRLKADVSGV